MKVLIYGPPDHVFSRVIVEMSSARGLSWEITANNIWTETVKIISEIFPDLILLINKKENEAAKIWNLRPATIIMTRGGEKDFQPRLERFSPDGDHYSQLFQNWEEFMDKLTIEPPQAERLLTRLPSGLYRPNPKTLEGLKEAQRVKLGDDFFWFSLYYSRVYLDWLNEWLKKVDKYQLETRLDLPGKGKIRRLLLPLHNLEEGELIFREGEEIFLFNQGNIDSLRRHADYKKELSYYRRFAPEESKSRKQKRQDEQAEEEEKLRLFKLWGGISGLVISADEDNVEIELEEATEKPKLNGRVWVRRGHSLIKLMIESYSAVCSGYSDLSRKDFIYDDPGYYDQPQDFLRGFIPNWNPLHLGIDRLDLSGKAGLIRHDNSQVMAMLEALSPSFISLINGGPGTGKTLLTAAIVKQMVLAGQTVLVTSHSNQGLDNLLLAIMEQVDDRLIFRLGNKSGSVTDEKVKKLHREYRYAKLREKARKKAMEEHRTKHGDKAEKTPLNFDPEEFDLKQENERIWELVQSGQGFILAATVNSCLVDKQLNRLSNQNDILHTENFRDNLVAYGQIGLVPKIIKKMLDDNPKALAPIFEIHSSFIDEATRVRFFEFVPIIQKTRYKLVLIGDLDQLGNVEIGYHIRRDLTATMYSEGIPYQREGYQMIFPRDNGIFFHPLKPRVVSEREQEEWAKCFSQGVLYSLVEQCRLPRFHLNINRRSLGKITEFINFVFGKDLKVGRFHPTAQGLVTCLDAREGEEERIRTSYRNKKEKSLAVREFLKYHHRRWKAEGKTDLSSLVIITLYRSQIRLISGRLRKELLFNPIFKGLANPENIDSVLGGIVNTVDAFQGSERRCVILSLVRANDEKKIGFGEDLRRIYVALTRAQESLIIIGHLPTFLDSKYQLIQDSFGKIISFTKKEGTYAVKK